MAHKYLENILPKGKSPYDFECDDEIRNQKWEKEREECGFDERETWNLDFTFFCWLYERLMKYKEVSPVDLNCKIVPILISPPIQYNLYLYISINLHLHIACMFPQMNYQALMG